MQLPANTSGCCTYNVNMMVSEACKSQWGEVLKGGTAPSGTAMGRPSPQLDMPMPPLPTHAQLPPRTINHYGTVLCHGVRKPSAPHLVWAPSVPSAATWLPPPPGQQRHVGQGHIGARVQLQCTSLHITSGIFA